MGSHKITLLRSKKTGDNRRFYGCQVSFIFDSLASLCRRSLIALGNKNTLSLNDGRRLIYLSLSYLNF